MSPYMTKMLKSLGLLAPGAALSALALGATQILNLQIRRRWTTELELTEPCFYSVKDSMVAGEPLRLAFHAPTGGQFTVSRLSERVDPPVLDLEIDPIVQSGQYDFWAGVDWSEKVVETDAQWRPGLYLMELVSGGTTYRQALAVASPEPLDIAVIVSTNTWVAYNPFGGLSNYIDTANPWLLRGLNRVCQVMSWRLRVGDRKSVPALPLPEFRPNDRINRDLLDVYADAIDDLSHLTRAEWAFLRVLDDAGHSYNVFGDRDMVYTSGPTSAKLMIFVAHSEYWSAEMMSRFNSYVSSGGKALFVSGNNWYRQVKHLARGLEVVDQRVDDQMIAQYLGTGYTADGYGEADAYGVVDPHHQAFEGLSVQQGQVFGGEAGAPGASGHETDKINLGSGQLDILAIGLNAEGPAFLTWKDNAAGGWVCNFSSALAAPWVERCSVMQGIVNNAIRIATSG